MAKTVAMLRGINVGGHKAVSMEALRSCFQALGFKEVQTYVQSGNVIFEGAPASTAVRVKKIETKIRQDLGFPVSVLLRTAKEFVTIGKNNPFSKSPTLDPSRLYVTFLSQAPSVEAKNKLERFRDSSEHFQMSQREIYLYFPQGYGRAKLTNNVFERLLSVKATTRNWTTINKLLEMLR